MPYPNDNSTALSAPLLPAPYFQALNNGAFAVVLVLAFLGWFGWRSLARPILAFLANYLATQQEITRQQSDALAALKDGLQEQGTLHIGALDKLGAALEHRDKGLDDKLAGLAQGQREIKDRLTERRSPRRWP